jgi:hypothetical protein
MGDHIGAEHYDRAAGHLCPLQDGIVRKIVTTLNLQLAVSGHSELWLSVERNNLQATD